MNKTNHWEKRILWLFALYIFSFTLSGCRSLLEPPSKPMNSSHIQTLKKPPENFYSPPPIRPKKLPTLSPSVSPKLKKCVSISITEEVPLKDAFIELSRQVEVDLQLDSKVTQRVVFTASKRPFIDVIKDICELAGLRYKIMGTAIRVEVDTPYSANYSVQFLNLARSSENRISIATDVFSSIKDNKASADNGSNSSVVGKGNNDFWTEVQENLKTILATGSNPKDAPNASNYSLHRQGGLISIFGTARQHQLVSDYLKHLRQVVSTQVLIEAKVIEVSLNDQYRGGINWQKLTGGDLHADISLGDFAQRGRFMDPTSAQADMLSFGLQGKTFATLLKAIEEFGASRTLSSPRLTVMNNQTAILKVAQNQVYFRLNYDKQFNLAVNRENVTVSSDIQTVPIGLVMSVQPSIDYETGKIILSLRPTISRLTHSVSDPAVEIALTQTRESSSVKTKPSLIPVVEVREIDSVLLLQSGEIAVLGGLMEVRTTSGTAKVPGAGDIPVLGQLFSASAESDEVIELVILIRASIVDDSPSLDAADQRLYEDYIDDPRRMEIRN